MIDIARVNSYILLMTRGARIKMLKVEKDQTDIPTLDFTEELIRELAEIKLYSKVPTASMPVYHVSHSIIPIFDDKKRNYSVIIGME